MERKQYLELCQKVSILRNEIYNNKDNISNELKVIFNGVIYYPMAYELSFKLGQVVHKAILHDLKSNSIIYADLNKVDKL